MWNSDTKLQPADKNISCPTTVQKLAQCIKDNVIFSNKNNIKTIIINIFYEILNYIHTFSFETFRPLGEGHERDCSYRNHFQRK